MHEDIIFFTDRPGTDPFRILMCGQSFCDGSYQINRPKSAFYCFEYIRKGRGYVRVGDTRFCAQAGDIYLLPAGEDHFYYSDSEDPWEKLWFNASGPLIESTLQVYGLKDVFHVRGLDAEAIFRDFLAHAAQIRDAADDRFHFDACAVDLLKLVQLIAAAPGHREKGRAADQMHLLKNRLDTLTDFSTPFSALIEDSFYTQSHLIRTFKAAYGVTPYEYLLQRKLSTAKLLLKSTAMSITQIAHQLGFEDHHYFSSFFTRRTGCSPRKFRKL